MMDEKLVVGVGLLDWDGTRLRMLYQKAAGYAVITYESMYASDTAMAAWLMKNADCIQVDR